MFYFESIANLGRSSNRSGLHEGGSYAYELPRALENVIVTCVCRDIVNFMLA